MTFHRIFRWIPSAVSGLVSLAFTLGLGACVSSGGGGDRGTKKSSTTPVSPLEEGRKIFVGRCTACHSPEPILDYTLQEWRDLLPEMSADAKLNATQEQALMAYIESHF